MITTWNLTRVFCGFSWWIRELQWGSGHHLVAPRTIIARSDMRVTRGQQLRGLEGLQPNQSRRLATAVPFALPETGAQQPMPTTLAADGAASASQDPVHDAAGSAAPLGITAAAAAAPAAPPAAQPPRKRAAGAPKGATAPSLDTAKLGKLQHKGLRIAEQLGQLYPDPPIPLGHSSHFQLICAVLLSAQTTDKKVNEVTPALFKLAPDAQSMAGLEVGAIQECIQRLGLAPTKAKNLKAMAQMLLERHGGAVPDSFEALEALAGVGHKTASVVMAQAFGRSAFPVDTHIHRLAQRWGLTAGRSVEQTEADLKLVFPERLWRDLHLQIIYFGREHCPARGHDPAACAICSWAAVPPYDRAGASPLKPGQRTAAGTSNSRPLTSGKSPAKLATGAGTKAAPKRSVQSKPAAASKRPNKGVH